MVRRRAAARWRHQGLIQEVGFQGLGQLVHAGADLFQQRQAAAGIHPQKRQFLQEPQQRQDAARRVGHGLAEGQRRQPGAQAPGAGAGQGQFFDRFAGIGRQRPCQIRWPSLVHRCLPSPTGGDCPLFL